MKVRNAPKTTYAKIVRAVEEIHEINDRDDILQAVRTIVQTNSADLGKLLMTSERAKTMIRCHNSGIHSVHSALEELNDLARTRKSIRERFGRGDIDSVLERSRRAH